MTRATLLVLLILSFACSEDQKTAEEMKVYEGPVRQAENVIMDYSEEAIRKVVLKADKLLEFKNGNREFPEGMFVEFYDENGKLSSTLRGDKGYFNKIDNQWKATGNVVVKSYTKDQQLNSEELYWKPDQERIFTEDFVTIRSEREVIAGTGFESSQDFVNWEIKNSTGIFELDEVN